jgi:hypothetical protein
MRVCRSDCSGSNARPPKHGQQHPGAFAPDSSGRDKSYRASAKIKGVSVHRAQLFRAKMEKEAGRYYNAIRLTFQCFLLFSRAALKFGIYFSASTCALYVFCHVWL